MATFAELNTSRLNPHQAFRTTPVNRAIVKNDLGILQDRNQVRASGTVTRPNSVLYTFEVESSQALGVQLTDRSSRDNSGKRTLKVTASLFDDDNRKVLSSAGRRENNVLSFQANLVPGLYSIKIVPRGSKQVQYRLILSPGLV